VEEDWEIGLEGDGGWHQLPYDDEDEEEDWDIGALARPGKCALRGAHPRVVVDPAHARVRLALHYRARSATSVGATVKLKGTKGSLRLLAGGHHPARQGTLRLKRHLRPGALRKARSARVVLVRFDAPKTSSFCQVSMRLQAKHAAGGLAIWSAAAPQH